MPRPRPVTLLLVLLLAVLSSSCTMLRRGQQVPQERVTVRVVNQNFHDATIFAYVNSARQRVGRVVGNQTGTFTVRYPAAGQLTFEIRLLAVGAYTSQSISVVPNDTVMLTVPSDLHFYAPRR